MSRRGHVPQRMCVGCGARGSQATLVRFVVALDGTLVRMGRGAHTGRSAYLHDVEACWRKFGARKGPLRSLGRSVGRESRMALVEVLRLGSTAQV